MACSDFSAKRAVRRQSPIDVFSSALPKLPVSSSLVAMVPHTIMRSPSPQPGKLVFSDPKTVLQQYPRLRTSSGSGDMSESANNGRRSPSFDHLVGAQQECFRDRQTDCL